MILQSHSLGFVWWKNKSFLSLAGIEVAEACESERGVGFCRGLEHGVWEAGAWEHLSRECIVSSCGLWGD